MSFALHTKASCPPDSVELLDRSTAAYGMIPNLHAMMAESPALLDAYQTLTMQFAKSSLTAVEQQVVILTVSYENRCTYCVAAHTVIASMQKVPEHVVHAIRDGLPIKDKTLEALRRFTSAMVATRGWPDDVTVQKFADAGYSEQNALDVILGIGLKTLSNYTNHISDTPLDDAFATAAWSRPV